MYEGYTANEVNYRKVDELEQVATKEDLSVEDQLLLIKNDSAKRTNLDVIMDKILEKITVPQYSINAEANITLMENSLILEATSDTIERISNGLFLSVNVTGVTEEIASAEYPWHLRITTKDGTAFQFPVYTPDGVRITTQYPLVNEVFSLVFLRDVPAGDSTVTGWFIPDKIHNHDDRYYTVTEIDEMFEEGGKLSDSRSIDITTDIENDEETDIEGAKFDGTEDVEIIIKKLNAAILSGTTSIDITGNAATATSAGSATKLATARNVGINTNISGDTTTDITASSFDGSKDANITIKKLNAGVLSGTASIDITGNASTATSASSATKLSTARNISIKTNISDDKSTEITAASFDGSKDADITIKKLNAGVLSGTASIDITGNAATATSATSATSASKLSTARTITLSGSVTGSASFDGSGDITITTSTNHSHSYLSLSGGTMTGVISSSLNTGTHLAGNQGTAIINSTSTEGYVMLAKMNSTNGVFTLGKHGTGFKLFYTAKSTVDAGTNTYTKQVTLMDESGNSTFNKVTSTEASITTLTATTSRSTTTSAGYVHRNIAYGTSETPTNDATYGGSGSIYIQYS